MRTGKVGPDLGIDHRCARPGPMPKAATQEAKAIASAARIGAMGAPRSIAQTLFARGRMAAELYALKAMGASQSKISRLRRARATYLLTLRPCMCLTTALATSAGKGDRDDPLLAVPIVSCHAVLANLVR